MSSSPPAALGRYVIERELGRGAMGVVYRARDPRIDRPVALKTLSPQVAAGDAAAAIKERFLTEGRAAGRLSHPGIVAVYDADEDGATGIAYLAMELVEGTDLRELLRQSITPARLVGLLAEVARALEHAHARGVIHRDVKPANILVDAEGHARLTDFGIARLGDSTITRDGEFVGTPAYMAPEQVVSGPITPQTDVHALGVILYEGLTGARPFTGESMVATATAIATLAPTPPSRLASVPIAFDAVVARALAKNPAERHASAAAFAADIERALASDALDDGTLVTASDPRTGGGGPQPTAPDQPPAPTLPISVPGATRRRRLIAAVAGTLLAGLLAVLWLASDREPTGAEGDATAATQDDSGPTAAAQLANPTAARDQAVPKPTAPVARAAPSATLVVSATSPRGGRVTIREGQRVLGSVELSGKRRAVGFQLRGTTTLTLAPGKHWLTFVFDGDDGKALTTSLETPLASDATTRVIVDVGTLGRALQARIE